LNKLNRYTGQDPAAELKSLDGEVLRIIAAITALEPSLVTLPATAGVSPVIAVNWKEGRTQKVTLGHTGTATITLAGGIAGLYTLILKQPVGGGCVVDYTITGARWVGGTEATQTTTALKKDVLSFVFDGDDYLVDGAVNF
jgi:hypothetical protein